MSSQAVARTGAVCLIAAAGWYAGSLWYKSDENEVAKEVVVNVPPFQAYDAFMTYIWWGGGGLPGSPPTLVTQAEDKLSGQGSVRAVPGGIHERILAAAYGDFIEYTLIKGPFPVSTHIGRISFKGVESSGDDKQQVTMTRISWTVKYTPYFCMDSIVRLFLTSLSLMLSNLKLHLEQESERKIH